MLGAAAIAGSSVLRWFDAPDGPDVAGSEIGAAALTGGAVAPALVPLALVALAGLGATLATSGLLRRFVGAALVLCAVIVGVVTVTVLLDPPSVVSVGGGPDPPGALGDPVQPRPIPPGLALLGGALVAVGGGAALAGGGQRRGLSSRYESPAGAQRAAPRPGGTGGARGPGGAGGTGGATPAPAAIAEGDWWKALDAGADPTVDGLPPSDSPGSERGREAR